MVSLSGDWLSWLERCLHTAEVTGSNPVSPTPRITHAEINGVDSFETSVMHGDRGAAFLTVPRMLEVPALQCSVLAGGVDGGGVGVGVGPQHGVVLGAEHVEQSTVSTECT